MRSGILFLVIVVFITISPTFGQTNTQKVVIKGVVVDVNQNPVPGAIIIVDGNRSTKSTDKKGIYKIKVKSSAEKIGIFTLPPVIIEEQINGRKIINFTLDTLIVKQITGKKNTYGDEEVSIGYGTEKRKNLTTSVGKIDGTKERYASYNTIYDMLRGEIPGVQVEGTSVRIREAASSLSGNEPLFVVDGVPVNSIDGILPQMVRSIEVLKGSAASIYGSRGTNGVIIISLSDAKKSR
jgi:TonB-dependent SusC/RagA subfamily outer membrane receptor